MAEQTERVVTLLYNVNLLGTQRLHKTGCEREL